jgi:polysaccharide biosynthesis/export protein
MTAILDAGLKLSMNEKPATRVRFPIASACCLIALLLIGTGGAYGQTKPSPPSGEITTSQTNEKIQQLAALGRRRPIEILIGSGDVLHIEVYDVPELTRDVRVDPTGMIGLPLIPGTIPAAGITPYDLQGKIADLLRENGLVANADVSVAVREQHSQPVLVIGAVRNAQVVQLVRPTTLLELLALSGGVADDAGAVVLVVRRSPVGTPIIANAPGKIAAKSPPAGTPGTLATSDLNDLQGNDAAAAEIAEMNEAGSQTISIRLRDLLDSGDPTYNIPVYGGDTVSVPRSGIVYVTGAIVNPGGYVLQSHGAQVTALEVVALAHGLTGTAKMNDAVIVRKNPDTGQTVEIPVRLKDIFNRKVADVRMLPNDIMIVPDSMTKKALAKGSQAAVTVGSGVAIYRSQ